MRLLVLARDEERRRLLSDLVVSAGHEARASVPARLLSAVAALRPDGLVIDGVEDPEGARRDLERVRPAVDANVPVLLVVRAGWTWLRAQPGDLAPAVALVESELAARLHALAGDVGVPVNGGAGSTNAELGAALAWRPESREVGGPAGTAVLTTSEALIVDLLLRHPGLVVPASALSRALWGDAILDGHGRAAIRSHIYTLRRKLRTVGLPSALVSAPGWGYRLDAAAVSRTDVGGRG